MKQWFVWDGQRWKPDDGGGMTLLAKQTALSLYALAAQETDEHRRKALARWAAESETERRLKSTVSLAQSEPGMAIDADRLDSDPLVLNVLNGTLDLRTGELRPARREDFITKMAPVTYTPDAVCPEYERMLNRLFEHVPSVRQYLQRIFGYALTGLTIEQCFFLFHGKGSNGKSTLLNTVLSLLGEYGDASRPETFLVKHGVDARITLSYGATEAKIPEIADAVVDGTESGRALRAAGGGSPSSGLGGGSPSSAPSSRSNSSSGQARAGRTSFARSSCVAACSDTARFTGWRSSARRMMPGMTPTVLRVMCRGARARFFSSGQPLKSLRKSARAPVGGRPKLSGKARL
jgi:hypothetical protein